MAKKCFLGAAMAGLQVVGGIANAISQRKAKEQANIAANKTKTYEEALALTQARVNDFELQQDIDDRTYYGRLGCSIRKRCGGSSTKRAKLGTQTKYIDRSDMLRCGGRRRKK